MGWTRGIVGIAALCWAAALGGCVRYVPAPVDLAARASGRAATVIDRAAIAGTVARIAPAAPRQGAALDRLDLFAALLVHDPRIAEARAAVETARREARAARVAGGPTLTLTGEYANDPATSSPWLIGGTAALPLDFGPARRGRLDRAGLAVLAARYAYAETVWAERMALDRALIDYFAAAARLPLLSGLLALRERQVAALARREAAGETAGVTVYPFRAQRAQAARALEEARAGQQQALNALAGTLGLPAAALANSGLAWPEFAQAPGLVPSITAAERARAAAARADVLRALVAYDQAEADVHSEVGRQYPALSVAPGYTWERGLVKLPLSLGLSLPSYDLNRSAIRAALARRAQAGAGIETALAGAQAAIDSALAERAAALDSYRRIRDAELPPAEAGAVRADAQLREGAIARADWAAARITALEARLAAIDALVRLRQAEAMLEEAMRRPLAGPELAIDPAKLGDMQ